MQKCYLIYWELLFIPSGRCARFLFETSQKVCIVVETRRITGIGNAAALCQKPLCAFYLLIYLPL